MVDYVNGAQLPARLQSQAKARYVHRFTADHKPAWAAKPMPNGNAYPVQFASDADWLANTDFPVTKRGKLAYRPSDCYSRPTWPHNPELRKGAT